jgi:hypothetical protein
LWVYLVRTPCMVHYSHTSLCHLSCFQSCNTACHSVHIRSRSNQGVSTLTGSGQCKMSACMITEQLESHHNNAWCSTCSLMSPLGIPLGSGLNQGHMLACGVAASLAEPFKCCAGALCMYAMPLLFHAVSTTSWRCSCLPCATPASSHRIPSSFPRHLPAGGIQPGGSQEQHGETTGLSALQDRLRNVDVTHCSSFTVPATSFTRLGK